MVRLRGALCCVHPLTRSISFGSSTQWVPLSAYMRKLRRAPRLLLLLPLKSTMMVLAPGSSSQCQSNMMTLMRPYPPTLIGDNHGEDGEALHVCLHVKIYAS